MKTLIPSFIILCLCACAQSRGESGTKRSAAASARALPSVTDPVLGPDVDPSAGDAGAAACDGETCKEGQTCVRYYGVAGTRGPQFESCEWTCDMAAPQCPEGLRCVSIADGPGDVCRPPS